MSNGRKVPQAPERSWMAAFGLLRQLDQDAVPGVIVLGICIAGAVAGAETIPTYLLGTAVLVGIYFFKWLKQGRKDV